MAWRFVQQPNGLFARFSEVVDSFTHANLSTGAAFRYARATLGAAEAADKILRAIADEHRWEEALRVIEAVHGAHERRAIVAEIENEADIIYLEAR